MHAPFPLMPYVDTGILAAYYCPERLSAKAHKALARLDDPARDWIGSFSAPRRTLDALHLAAAFGNDLALLTADKALARSARHFGVTCEVVS